MLALELLVRIASILPRVLSRILLTGPLRPCRLRWILAVELPARIASILSQTLSRTLSTGSLRPQNRCGVVTTNPPLATALLLPCAMPPGHQQLLLPAI